MTTLSIFNNMLESFVNELIMTFPEERQLSKFHDELKLMLAIDDSAPMKLLMNALTPHVDMIMSKNPALFDQDIAVGTNLDLKALWHAPDITDATRDAMWQHIQSLFLFGTSLSFMPPETLKAIETTAHQAAERVQNGEQLDIAGMASSMMGLLMNSAGGAQPQQQIQGSKKKSSKK